MRLTSIRTSGAASRRFMSGTRLWPPASTLASSPCSASSATHSSTERGAKYTKRDGFIASTPGAHGGQTETADQLLVTPADDLLGVADRPLVETPPGLRPERAGRHTLGQRGLRLAGAIEVGQKIAVDRLDHVEAGEVGRLERTDDGEPDPEAGAHGEVDVLRRRDAALE